jgi:hypothetical protein
MDVSEACSLLIFSFTFIIHYLNNKYIRYNNLHRYTYLTKPLDNHILTYTKHVSLVAWIPSTIGLDSPQHTHLHMFHYNVLDIMHNKSNNPIHSTHTSLPKFTRHDNEVGHYHVVINFNGNHHKKFG